MKPAPNKGFRIFKEPILPSYCRTRDKETSERIVKERTKLIAELKELYYIEKNNYKIVNSIEDLFIKWWATQSIPDEIIEPFLIEMERPIDYLFIRRFVSPDYFVSDFNDLVKNKDSENRWEWYVHNIMCERWESNSSCVKEIADKLNLKYQSIEDIITFLVESDAKLSEYSGLWATPSVLTYWFSNNTKAFQDIYRNKELWSKIPKRFSLEIELAILKGNDDEFNELIEKILSKEGNLSRDLVEAFLALSAEKDIDSGILENCLNVIADIEEPYVVNILLFHLRSIFKENKLPNIRLRTLLKIAKKLDLENHYMLTHFSFNIKEIKDFINTAEYETFSDIRKLLINKIKNVNKLNYDIDVIMGQICENILEIAEIIVYRINYKKDKNCPVSFDVIPYEGLRCINDKINCYDDFRTFLEMLKEYTPDIDELWMDELKSLIKQISYKVDGNTSERYLSIYIRELLVNNEILYAVYFSYYLPRTIDSIDILTAVLEESCKQNYIKEIERLLFNLRRIDSLSWTTGQTPAELLVAKDFFVELLNRQLSARIKIVINKMLQSIDLEIDRIKKADEERLNPRF